MFKQLQFFFFIFATSVLVQGATSPAVGDGSDKALGGFFFSYSSPSADQELYLKLINEEQKKSIEIMQKPADNIDSLERIKLLKPGFYRLGSIRLGDKIWKGKKGAKKKLVLIRAGQVSNLGHFSLSPAKGKMLKVSFESPKARYQFAYFGEERFGVEINGFTGDTLAARKDDRSGFSRRGPGGSLMTSYSYQRTLALSYRLSLNHGRHAKPLLSMVDQRRQGFQRCYTEQVPGGVTPSGKISFAFQVPKQQANVKEVRLKKDELGIRKLRNCLDGELRNIRYPTKHDLKGVITFRFNLGEDKL